MKVKGDRRTMYVRWNKANRQRPHGFKYVSHIAVLVESKRIDGRPRQKVLKYLGSIESYLMKEPHIQRYFWKNVSVRLDSLQPPLTADERKKIEDIIQKTVPMPIVEDVVHS